MNTSLIRNKITIVLVSVILLSLLLFSVFSIKTFERYSRQVVFTFLYFHLEQIENVLGNYNQNHDDFLKGLNSLLEGSGKASKSKYVRTEIINSDGKVIASSSKEPPTENMLKYKEVADALSGERSSQARPDERVSHNMLFDDSYFAAIPLNTPYGSFIIRASTPGEKIDEIIRNLLAGTLSGLIIITLLSIFIIHKFIQKSLSPVDEILKVSNELSEGKLSAKVGYDKDDELGLLSNTINNLSEKLSNKIKELSNEKQKQELILEYMNNPVMLIDKDGRIKALNHRGRYLFHSNRNTCTIGKHNTEVLGSELLNKTIKQCLEEMSSKTIELKYENSNHYILQVFINPLPNTDGNSSDAVVCVFHDITAMIAIYEKHAEFIANASHELATPLTSIKGYSETLLDGALESRDLREKFVKIIHEESEHMQILVSDLLKIARLDAADYKNTIPFSVFSTKDILETVKERLEPQLHQKNLSITVEYLNPPVNIHANLDWLKQILINLTENAIKYSHENGNIRLRHEVTEGSAIFSIKDDGVGIAPESIPYIFDRFYRADKARGRNKAGGTGLGLSIAKLITEIFGGHINVKSKLNSGTTFYVSVPLAKEHDEEYLESNEETRT